MRYFCIMDATRYGEDYFKFCYYKFAVIHARLMKSGIIRVYLSCREEKAMAKWLSEKRPKRRVFGGTNSDHEFDYGEFYANYVKTKQKDMSRQRQQAQRVSGQIKKEQQRHS